MDNKEIKEHQLFITSLRLWLKLKRQNKISKDKPQNNFQLFPRAPAAMASRRASRLGPRPAPTVRSDLN